MYVDSCGIGHDRLPKSYSAFAKLFDTLPEHALAPLPPPSSSILNGRGLSVSLLTDSQFNVPSLSEMGYTLSIPTTPFRGGETEALKRLENKIMRQPQWVAKFAKPDTSPNALEPSTTVLSPYLKFGCLSVRLLAHELRIACIGKQSTKPPVSLMGQVSGTYSWMIGYCPPL